VNAAEASSSDERWMRRALELATEAEAAGEVPVGAVVVVDGVCVAEGRNRTRGDADPTAHAELVALRAAARAAGHWWLPEATVYVTLEPCAMCAGAMVLARVKRLVYGAADPKTGMCGSLGNLVQDPRLNHRVELTGGVLAEEAGIRLRSFFMQRR
jgi:tRNA(adenine34) deaminase